MKRSNHGRPVYVSFLLSYAILLGVIMLIASLIFARTIQMMEAETHTTYDSILTQTGKDVDTMLESYRRTALDLAMQTKIMAIAASSPYTDAAQRQTMIDITSLLRLSSTSNQAIERTYLYLPNKSAVLSSSGYSGEDEFFSNYQATLFESKPSWQNMMRSVSYNSIICRNGKLLFIVSLPIGRVGVYDGSIVLQVDAGAFLDRLGVIADKYNGSAAIVDASGQVILADDNHQEFWQPEVLTGKDFRVSQNGTNLLVNRVSSTASNWTYVTVVRESNLYNQTLILRNIILVASAVCLLLGIMLAFLFSRRNYLPLQHLMDIIRKEDTSTQPAPVNEFRYMEKTLQTFIREKGSMAEQLKEHWQERRDSCLRQLLRGSRDGLLAEQDVQILGLRFGQCWHLVFLAGGLPEAWLQETATIIESADSGIICCPMDGMVAGIISSGSENADVSSLTGSIEQVWAKLLLLRSTGVCLGYGSPCMQVEAFPVAFNEAHEALEYKTLLDGEGIICYDDLPERADNCADISFHDQFKLQNALKAGNIAEANVIFNEITTQYFPDAGASTQMIKCRMFGLINTMILSISETNIQKDDAFWESYKPVEKLLRCGTVRELIRESRAILQKLGQIMEDNRFNLVEQKRQDIWRYLRDNYTNPDLNVAMIAEHFEMHPTYLSRQFKQLNNVNLLDRIHELRISDAKKLLAESSLCLKEISQRIGYNNELSFFRAFKRVEGITPSQFRESCRPA